MDDFDAVPGTAEFLAHFFRDHDRAVLAAGAAESDCQVTLPLVDIVRKQVNKEI